MSAPSLNSLETAYGSCIASDVDSIFSNQTFRSARSSSTKYYSDESDTDTLINEDGSRSEMTSEEFFDVAESPTDDDDDDDHEDHLEGFHLRPASADNISWNLRLTEGPDSNTVPQRSDAESTVSTSTENAILLNPSETITSSLVEDEDHDAVHSVPAFFDLPQVDTHIMRSPRRNSTSATCQSQQSGTRTIVGLLSLFIFSLGFQTSLRFGAHLDAWVLTFWRSIVQLAVSVVALILVRESPLGPEGGRQKQAINTLLSSALLFCILFSAERLPASDLAAVYLMTPVGVLLIQVAINRSTNRKYFHILVVFIWTTSVLYLTRNTPWPNFSTLNQTTTSSLDWRPPIFALDSFYNFYPVQPQEFSYNKNETNHLDPFNGGSVHKISGLTVAILGLLVSMALPASTASVTTHSLWPLLTWHALSACAISVTGMLLMGKSFLVSTSMDWILLSCVVAFGLAANVSLMWMLTSSKQTLWPRLYQNKYVARTSHWSTQPGSQYQMPLVLVVIVLRAVLESLVIFTLNVTIFNPGQAVHPEDWLGLACLCTVAIVLPIVTCYPSTISTSWRPESPTFA